MFIASFCNSYFWLLCHHCCLIFHHIQVETAEISVEYFLTFATPSPSLLSISSITGPIFHDTLDFFFLNLDFVSNRWLLLLMNDICTISFFLWDWVNRCFWPFSSVSRSFPTELGSSGPKFKMILELQFLHLLIKSSLCCYSSVIYFTSEDLKFKTAFGLKQISVKIVWCWMSVKHSFPMLSLIPFLWYHLSLS